MSASRIDPRCVVCADAYGTGFMCDSCQADPANADWKEGRPMQHEDDPTGAFETKPWRPSEAYRNVVHALIRNPRASIDQIATIAGCSPRYVMHVWQDVTEAAPHLS